MPDVIRDAAREAAKLQWAADQYRRYGDRHAKGREHAEHLAVGLEELAASILCGSAKLTPMALANLR
ncbi:MAG: hypothetical protein AAGA21_22700 [Pseudomonadota bacterium]